MGPGHAYTIPTSLKNPDLTTRPLAAMLRAMAKCFECDGLAEHEHHVVPRSRGGTRTVPLCEGCHGKVHEKDMTTRALTVGALAAKKARGESTGQVPYGFGLAADGVRLEPIPEEQAVIAQAREFRATGLSLYRVGVELARAGMLPRRGRPGWHPEQIARMVGGVEKGSSQPRLAV